MKDTEFSMSTTSFYRTVPLRHDFVALSKMVFCGKYLRNTLTGLLS